MAYATNTTAVYSQTPYKYFKTPTLWNYPANSASTIEICATEVELKIVFFSKTGEVPYT